MSMTTSRSLAPASAAGTRASGLPVRVSSRALEIALEAILDRLGGGVVTAELVDSVTAASPAVPSVLLVEATPVQSRIGLAALDAGRVDAVLAVDDVDSLPLVLEALGCGLTAVSGVVRHRAAKLPELTRRQHELLSLLSGEYVKHARVGRDLACSPTTVKRAMRQLREMLALASRHDLPPFARSLGYSPDLADDEMALLCPGGAMRSGAAAR